VTEQTDPDVSRAVAAVQGAPWLAGAVAQVAADPAAIGPLFASVGRHCGRGPVATAPGWSTDDAARVRLLMALPGRGGELAGQVTPLYRQGSAAAKRAVLRALPVLDVGDAAVPLLHDAIRTNDPRLLAAALGPYAARLDAAAWRQAVLKCVFMGVPLRHVADLARRADAELASMLAGLAQERAAAGRALAEDAAALLRSLTD